MAAVAVPSRHRCCATILLLRMKALLPNSNELPALMTMYLAWLLPAVRDLDSTFARAPALVDHGMGPRKK